MPAARFGIGDNESAAFLQLFAAVLDEAALKAADLKSPFEVPPGALLVLRHTISPTVADLIATMRAPAVPEQWPAYLASRWPQLKGGVFWHALERSVATAPELGITDGGEICRVLAAVAQTLLTVDQRTRASNRALAREYRVVRPLSAPAPAPPVPLAQPAPTRVDPARNRQDERGVRLDTATLILLHASHQGPVAAGKSENQDATNAALVGTALVFALADGVSTSLGARYAACLAVERTCASLERRLPHSTDARQLLVDVAQEARTSLEDLLTQLLAKPDVAALGTELPLESARRILQNTRSGASKHLAPALSTTLITGIIRPAASDGARHEAIVLRIGDGVVEHVRDTGSVTPVFEMDPAVTEIAAAIGPGPLSAASFDPEKMVRTIVLEPGDVLVVSSDGLVRGHEGTVWATIAPLMEAASWSASSARRILERAAETADGAQAANRQSMLFDDNLSLILAGPRRPM